MVIDHGFPLEHLNQSGISYRYRSSSGRNRWCQPVSSHGAQVLGLLCDMAQGLGLPQAAPWLLYELPDALMSTMPMGALWPEVVDAVNWALTECVMGDRLTVLISVVSTDGDRHPNSLISRCAHALGVHARELGVRLSWMMAAGNSHSEQQNLSWSMDEGGLVEFEWCLPPENHRPSFLECWYNTPKAPARFSVLPPKRSEEHTSELQSH